MGFLDRLGGDGGDDDAAAAAARDHQARSLAQVEAGGLPLNAEQRLRELAGDAAGPFTSNLSVNEFTLTGSLGLEPIGQVMGSSIYKVGWQFTPWSQSGVMQVQTDSYNEARRLALGRLYQEAQLAGADVVVGVRIERGAHEFAGGSIEFIAQGTAMRIPSAPAGGRPHLTDLSLQDYWTLRVGGHLPVGVTAASVVYYVVASRATQKAESGWLASRRNQELVDFTQGVYTARELVLTSLQEQASALGANGIVGVTIDDHIRTHEVSGINDRTDLIVTFHAIGTAIRHLPDGRAITPSPTVSRGAPL
jgi:uncharacterized protein YbjQ (UPF0145 family)